MGEITDRRRREAKERLAVGAGLAAAGGVGGAHLARSAPDGKAPATLKHLRAGGSKAKAAGLLATRGAQVAGGSMAVGALANLKRKRPVEQPEVTGAEVAERLARATTGAQPKPTEKLPLSDKRRQRAEVARASYILPAALGGAALGGLAGKNAVARGVLSTAGGLGGASLVQPYADKQVRRKSGRRMKLDDEGHLTVVGKRRLAPVGKRRLEPVGKRRMTADEKREDARQRLRLMTDKQVQQGLSLGAGGLGLAATGMLAAPAGAKKLVARAAKKGATPNKTVKRVAEANLPSTAVTTTGAGVGGLGSLNFARIQGLESKREREALAREGVGKREDGRLDRYDAMAAGAGAGAGLLAAPMRPLTPRGARQDELKSLWSEAGGRGGKTVDMDVRPARIARVSEAKGKRIKNSGYTAGQAASISSGSYKPGEKRYTATLFRDPRTGNVTLRQQDSRHFAEAKTTLGQDVPSRFHMVEGRAPHERTGFKAISRAVSSARQRRSQMRNLDSPDATVRRKAEGRLNQITTEWNRRLTDKHGHKAGQAKVDRPWKGVKGGTGKKAAIVAGAGVAAGVGNEAVQRVKGQDTAKDLHARAKRRLERLGEAGEHVVKSETLDRDDALAALAGGGVAALAAPVRDRSTPRDMRSKYAHLRSGRATMSAADLARVASPGKRKHNIEYTTNMAQDIARGSYTPGPTKVAVYDDAVRTMGGAHRTHASGWAGKGQLPVEVTRVPGRYPSTTPLAVAAVKRGKRAWNINRFQRNKPKSTDELMRRAVDPEHVKVADSRSTPDPKKAPPAGVKSLARSHAGKGGAVASGALLGAALSQARERAEKSARPAHLDDWAGVVSKGKIIAPQIMRGPSKTTRQPSFKRSHIRRKARGGTVAVRGGGSR